MVCEKCENLYHPSVRVGRKEGIVPSGWMVARGGQEALGSGDLVQEVARRPGHQEVAKRPGCQGRGLR